MFKTIKISYFTSHFSSNCSRLSVGDEGVVNQLQDPWDLPDQEGHGVEDHQAMGVLVVVPQGVGILKGLQVEASFLVVFHVGLDWVQNLDPLGEVLQSLDPLVDPLVAWSGVGV